MVINDETPGLFSKSGEWPRASDYELIRENGRLYVIPTKNAKISFYRPFECFPDILKAFLSMAQELKTLNDSFNEWLRNEKYSDDQHRNKIEKRDEKEGKAIIRFARRYGLLGLFFDFIYNIEMWSIHHSEGEFKPIVRLTPDGEHAVRFSPYANKDFEGNNAEYDSYAKWFFPRLTSPYPMPNRYKYDFPDRANDRFWNEYAEEVRLIFFNSTGIYRKFILWQDWIKAEKRGASLDDSFDIKFPDYKWKYVLEFSVYPIGLTQEYNYQGQGAWQQRYLFASLINALKIMHLLDRTDTFFKVRVCERCGRIYLATTATARWCSKACGSYFRVTKNRSKEIIIQMHKDGISTDEISRQLKIDDKWIAEWLAEWIKEE